MQDKLMGNSNHPPLFTSCIARTFEMKSMWQCILEAHGINSSEEEGCEYEEITLRATVECYQ